MDINLVGAVVFGVAVVAGGASGQAPGQPKQAKTTEPTPAQLANFEAAADYSKQTGGDVLLIYMNGARVFAQDGPGWSADKPHLLASGSKSFWGIAAMAAVEDGLLTLDEKVSGTITEWKSDPRKSKITIRQLLTLSSGLDPGANFLERPLIADKMKQALGVKAIAEPGTTFRYGPSHYYVFIEVLKRKLAAKGMDSSPEAYLKRRVLDPLGITIAGWNKDRSGTIDPAGGARASATEWIKLGEFVQHQGRVEAAASGKQLISWDLLKQVFEPSRANPGYGLTWWLPSEMTDEQVADAAAGPMRQMRMFNRNAPPEAPKDSDAPEGNAAKPSIWMAAGLGGQRLYVIPGHNLTIVRLAHPDSAHRFSDSEFLHKLAGQADSPP
jgi:CubicO group peptidase (beta-lactamase class C family)